MNALNQLDHDDILLPKDADPGAMNALNQIDIDDIIEQGVEKALVLAISDKNKDAGKDKHKPSNSLDVPLTDADGPTSGSFTVTGNENQPGRPDSSHIRVVRLKDKPADECIQTEAAAQAQPQPVNKALSADRLTAALNYHTAALDRHTAALNMRTRGFHHDEDEGEGEDN